MQKPHISTELLVLEGPVGFYYFKMKIEKKPLTRGFMKGHPYYPPRSCSGQSSTVVGTWTNRLERDEFDMVARTSASGMLTVPGSDGEIGSAKLLRPKPPKKTVSDLYLQKSESGLFNENRLLNVGKTVEMWNNAFHEHTESAPNCLEPYISIKKERKKGSCVLWTLYCTKCQFTTKEYKTYLEVKSKSRGPKAAMPNVALVSSIQDSPIGIKKARLIGSGLDMPMPCRNAMQKMANKIGEKTVELGRYTLENTRNKMKVVNEIRGLKDTHVIRAKADTRYNTDRITSRHKKRTKCFSGTWINMFRFHRQRRNPGIVSRKQIMLDWCMAAGQRIQSFLSRWS